VAEFFFWVAELFWQNSAESELGRTSQIRPNPNFGASLLPSQPSRSFLIHRRSLDFVHGCYLPELGSSAGGVRIEAPNDDWTDSWEGGRDGLSPFPSA
jgi:hypothetical protein